MIFKLDTTHNVQQTIYDLNLFTVIPEDVIPKATKLYFSQGEHKGVAMQVGVYVRGEKYIRTFNFYDDEWNIVPNP